MDIHLLYNIFVVSDNQFNKRGLKMARQLASTTLIKQAIHQLGIDCDHLRHFTDKRKYGHRLKFYGIEPSAEQITQLNDWFKTVDIIAIAGIAGRKKDPNRGWSSRYYTQNKLTIHITN
jgi:hypothetical protein